MLWVTRMSESRESRLNEKRQSLSSRSRSAMACLRMACLSSEARMMKLSHSEGETAMPSEGRTRSTPMEAGVPSSSSFARVGSLQWAVVS